MAKRTDWAVNVDKLRVCFTMPDNLYSYLNEHYTRYDELTNARILDEDDFSLVFIEDDETKMSAVLNVRDVDGYGEYYTRSRIKMSKLPTLYFSQAKDTDMKMRIYDKARELNESSPQKTERLKEWLGWEDIDTLFRVEVVLHNTNVREFIERYGERLYSEVGEHSNVLNLLGMSEFRTAMFLDSSDRLIYFREKKTREKISLVEVCSGI